MKVEIWSDVACPWCYIGKRRFESALAHFAHREQVEVTWRSYQLDPSAPRDPGQTVNEILAQKYGVHLSQAAAMNERVSAIAAQEGLEYHLGQAKYGNTFDAHSSTKRRNGSSKPTLPREERWAIPRRSCSLPTRWGSTWMKYAPSWVVMRMPMRCERTSSGREPLGLVACLSLPLTSGTGCQERNRLNCSAKY